MYGGVVYHASCKAINPYGNKRVVVLLYSPPERYHSIINQAEAISSFLTSFVDEHNVIPDDIELYIFTDTLEPGSKPHIGKYEVSKASILSDLKEIRAGILRKIQLVGPSRLEINLEDIASVPNETHEDWLIDLFRLPAGKEMARRSKQVLERLNQSIASASEPA